MSWDLMPLSGMQWTDGILGSLYFVDEKEINAFVVAEKFWEDWKDLERLESLRCVTPTGQSLAAWRGNLHV